MIIIFHFTQVSRWIVLENLTTFEPKPSKQQACNAKAQKGVDQELELKSQIKKKCAEKQHQWVSKRELMD